MSSKRAFCASFPLMLLVCACSASPGTREQAQDGYERSEHTYQIPDAVLTDAYGKSISLAQEIEADEPIMLNFFYTRCTTVCPAMSASFAEVQRELGPEMRKLRLMSITIDPEYDSATRLRAYASQHRTGRAWMLLTGRRAEIVPVQKAFDSYSEDKGDCKAVTFLRAGANSPWVRIEGVASGPQLVAEYRQLMNK